MKRRRFSATEPLRLILGFVNFLLLTYLALITNRSLNLNDESYYILSGWNADNIDYFVTAQHTILEPIWKISENLTVFRLIGLLLLYLSSWFMAAVVSRILLNRQPSWVEQGFSFFLIRQLTIIFGLVYAATISTAPSYNLLGAVFTYCLIGCFLRFLESQSKRRILYFVPMGIFFFGLAASKLLVVLSLTAIFLFYAFLSRCFFPAIKFIFVSQLFGLLLFFLYVWAFSSLAEAYAAQKEGFELFSLVQSQTFFDRALGYMVDIFRGYSVTFFQVGAALILTGLSLLGKSRALRLASLAAFLGCIIFFSWWRGGEDRYQEIAIFFTALVSLLLILNYKTVLISQKLFPLVVLLFLSPYAASFGSGNSMFNQVIISMATWGSLCAILILALLNEHRSPSRRSRIELPIFYLLVASCIPTAIVVSNGLTSPYQLAAPYQKQNLKLSNSVVGDLLVDEKVIRLSKDIQDAKALCRIDESSNFISLFNNPGLALLFELRPRITPWINNLDQASFVLRKLDSSPEGILFSVDASFDFIQFTRNYLDSNRNTVPCGSSILPNGKNIDFWYLLPAR
jgi:hypothetical protein